MQRNIDKVEEQTRIVNQRIKQLENHIALVKPGIIETPPKRNATNDPILARLSDESKKQDTEGVNLDIFTQSEQKILKNASDVDAKAVFLTIHAKGIGSLRLSLKRDKEKIDTALKFLKKEDLKIKRSRGMKF